MAFTAELGVGNAQPGNIELGTAGSASPAVAVTVPAPEVRSGPPLAGAPWAKMRVEATPRFQPPPPAVSTSPNAGTPEVRGGPPLRGAPWFRIQIDTAPPAAPKFVPLPATPGATEVKSGPPIYGAPWTNAAPLLAAPAINPPTPTVRPVSQPMPEVHGGPPMAGAPWVQVVPATSPPVSAVPPGGIPPPPPPVRPSHNRTFLPRVPDIDTPIGKDRLTRFTQILSDVVNSLLGEGQLVQTGPASWTINAAGSGGGSGLTGQFP